MLTAADQERLDGGSNTESSRGYESDTRMRQGSLTSPDHNGGGGGGRRRIFLYI